MSEGLGSYQFVAPLETNSEAQLRAILEAAVDGIISIDEQGIIQTINPAAERMFGYAEDELIGQNVRVLMPLPYREEHDSYIERYLRTGQKRIIGIGREAVAMRKDGTVFPVELSVAEAHVSGKRIFVGIIRDITERKRAEAALRQSHEELEKLVSELRAKDEEVRSMTQQLWHAAKLASVGELAASIAHELNNPLSTVTLRVEALLAHTSPEDPRRRALEIVDQELKRMSHLVSNLLQFSRRGREQISTLDIRQELNKAVELIYYHFRKRGIEVVQEYDPATPVIFADRQKLRQVFLNILTNASDAMPRGGVLTLRTMPVCLPDGRSGVRIECQDTGEGIAPEHMDRVFDPFFTTKEEGKGTGLGLAICRRIVQEHHGHIEIESRLGRGTLVRILLPVRNGTNASRVKEAGL